MEDPAGNGAPEIIELGGRRFRFVTENSIEREIHWSRLLISGGLSHLRSFPGESPDDFATRVRRRLIQSGMLLELLAIQLVPLGDDWSLDLQKETCEHLRYLTNKRDVDTTLRVFIHMLEEMQESGAGPFLCDGGSEP